MRENWLHPRKQLGDQEWGSFPADSLTLCRLDSCLSVKGGAVRNSRNVALPAGRNRVLVPVCLFCALTLLAQKNPTMPKYDSHSETKMTGVVEELRLPPKGSEKEMAHLLIKNATETVDIYLCPKSFFDNMEMGFNKGDELSFTGSRVKQDGADIVLVREVVKGNDTYVLRDAKGSPVWK